jgi:ATP-dependent Clp protease ATP-binding subunit ClpB
MNFEQYSERSRGFLQAAQTLAQRRGHQRLTPEHLLYTLAEDPKGLVAGLLQAAGGDAAKLKRDLEAVLEKLPRVEGSGAGQVFMAPELSKVFEQAEKLAEKSGDTFVTVERLLLALAMAAGTPAAKLIGECGTDPKAINQAINERAT